MKIPILYIPKTKYKKFLHIEKSYYCEKKIIPIGCDCHPAYTLQKLNIRKLSLPFDWLNTDPIKGLKFVYENLENNFIYFIEDLKVNSRNHIVSKKYPYAEFMHEKNLIKNKSDRIKFERRINRLKLLLKNDTFFLFNITSESLKSEKNVSDFYNSVLIFKNKMKKNQTLCIYIRYDENLNENEPFCNTLFEKLNNLKNINITKYIRNKSKEGIWGNKKYYPKLYKSLGIKIYLTFPKIYLK